MNGTDLLAEFRKTRSEGAFSELVRRYTNLVYSAANRRLSHAGLAQEVTQIVFIRLAKAVPNLRGDAELVAWLHRTTVHVSIDLWRTEMRRRAREEHAVAMQPDPTETTAWTEISPILDEALNELTDADHQVILLRFFEQKTMRDLGLVLGITEDAAKMRVSRAVERLRTQFTSRGVTCAVVLLETLLAERSVEAAPVEVVNLMASLRVPAASSAGIGALDLFLQLPRAKLVAGLASALIIAAAVMFMLTPLRREQASKNGDASFANPPSAAGSATGLIAAASESPAGAEPDPLKLLQAVARARLRVYSGEMEFLIARYEFDRPLDGTNLVQVKAVFDGEKRRFESSGHEYAYASMADDAREVTDARRQAEGLDHEAAVRAGLLNRFESHRNTIYDRTVVMVYSTVDDNQGTTSIDEPSRGGAWSFDPRCLGIDTTPGIADTVESCLPLGPAGSVQRLGKEAVEGVPAWHVRLPRGSMIADFWVEVARPTLVIKHTFNGSEVVSKYDEKNPKDPIPIEVREMFLHGTVGRKTAFSETRRLRRNARFNIQVDPVNWTLTGLGMKAGTDVSDSRVMRRIGYWTGTGLSENFSTKAAPPQNAPDPVALSALLENEPGSPAGFGAAEWLLLNTQDGPEVEKAAGVILQDHITSTNLLRLSQELERMRHGCSSNLLTAMLEQNPSAEIRGNACFTLATFRKDAGNFGKNKQATAEAEKLLERVIADFGQVKRSGAALADLAKPDLSELRRLTIGKPAPDIEGEDLEGHPLKLSTYRGKVVVLRFWSACCLEAPELKKLLTRMDGKPFAIVCVNCDRDLARANSIIEKDEVTWPSFRDGRDGPISAAWNVHGWPTTYVLDRTGIIRYRDLREWDLGPAVETLLKE